MEQRYTESKIQHICVEWFRDVFPDRANLLFAVPNGGWRGTKAGAVAKYEGQVRGVADLIFLYPSNGKSSLCIEMKRPKAKGRPGGRQEPVQKEWQDLVESNGSAYVICRGLPEFIKAVCDYLGVDSERYICNALNKYLLYI